jgi:MYXO-CTERM domain-containing protein
MIRRIFSFVPARVLQLVTLLSTVFAVALFARDASAGSWRLKSNEVSEVAGAWHIFVSIELSSPPSLAHVPMKFSFTKLVEYERALVDGHTDPVMNRTVLTGQMPQVITQDVDFADGTGKIFKGTRFDFGVTRAVGFVAGEYKIQLRTSDGTEVGGPVNITLKGDNPVVDRRSITFNAKDPKKDNADAGKQVASNDTGEAAIPNNADIAPVGSAAPFIPDDAYKPLDENGNPIKEHPKGCGCSVPRADTTSFAWLALPALAGLVVLRRRRR